MLGRNASKSNWPVVLNLFISNKSFILQAYYAIYSKIPILLYLEEEIANKWNYLKLLLSSPLFCFLPFLFFEILHVSLILHSAKNPKLKTSLYGVNLGTPTTSASSMFICNIFDTVGSLTFSLLFICQIINFENCSGVLMLFISKMSLLISLVCRVIAFFILRSAMMDPFMFSTSCFIEILYICNFSNCSLL